MFDSSMRGLLLMGHLARVAIPSVGNVAHGQVLFPCQLLHLDHPSFFLLEDSLSDSNHHTWSPSCKLFGACDLRLVDLEVTSRGNVEVGIGSKRSRFRNRCAHTSLFEVVFLKLEFLLNFFPLLGVPPAHSLRSVILWGTGMFQDKNHRVFDVFGFSNVGGHNEQDDNPPHENVVLP